METSGQLGNTNAATGRVVSQTWSTQQIQVEVDAQDAGMLVFAQSHYHPWHAKIDGATRPIWRANYAYQAVEVPAGRHHVTLTYEDAWFRRGWIVAGITLAIVLLLLMLVRRPESPLDSPACG